MDMKFVGAVIVLFVLLSPGVLLHLPFSDEYGKSLNPLSGNTSLVAAVFHGFVFALLLMLVCKVMGVRVIKV